MVSRISSIEQLKPQPRHMQLRGVRVHNLKNLNLDIPLDRLVVVSGVSGSGKSSLAFDTLFREGQRRFIEGFSIAARRQLERIEPPDADRIAQVPVAIAIRGDRAGARSTVASLAELLDGLRLLYSRVGHVICPGCGKQIRPWSTADVAKDLTQLPDGTRCQLVFVSNLSSADDPVATWLSRGFTRAIWNSRTHDLSSKPVWPPSNEVWIVADRFVVGKVANERVLESVESAFGEGEGRCSLLVEASSASPSSGLDPDLTMIDGRHWQHRKFSRRLECLTCKRTFLPAEPRLFSHFSSGACPTCRGTGQASPTTNTACPACHGSRLREEALVVKISNANFADLCHRKPPDVVDFLVQLAASLTREELDSTVHVRAELLRRLQAVIELGLDYLSLDRSADSLSIGERCRLGLAACIGSRITGTLVVVDEPSSGLCNEEMPRIISALHQIRSARNSLVVVDHSPSIVAAADHLIELGPGAGPAGGSLVFQGIPFAPGAAVDQPVTDSSGKSASAKRHHSKSTIRAEKNLELTTINFRDFSDFHAEFPLRHLSLVTGSSGSGKTTLLVDVLYPAVCKALGLPCEANLPANCELTSAEGVTDVVLVDQSPLTKSNRSNPATWLEVFDEIRRTFALTNEARIKGFTPQHFSFNSASGGRCRSCSGTGLLKHDMQFLPDVTLVCPECKGTRYRSEVLEVKYRGRSIADVLAMSVSEAAAFFRSQPRLQTRFRMLEQIGLDYLALGQPSETLSGGEAQRLKLASRLTAPNRGPSLIICDEPTTGLHPADVRKLVACFHELIANGHTVVLADNNPDLVIAADHVIELKKR